MDKWIVYALVSMVFAGFTSVIAKMGLVGISGELGLTVRTIFVAGFVFVFAAMFVSAAEFRQLTPTNYLWLGISAWTTTASWIFYYKALSLGNVSTIALIDKGSFIVAVMLAAFILKEQITLRVLLGCVLIAAGLFVVASRPAGT